MLYAEIAIKPELLEPTIERLADLDGKFGFAKGALISKLPMFLWGTYKQEVSDTLIDGTSKDSAYAEECLRRLENAFIRFGRQDPKPESWLDDILRLHGEKPFSAIVSNCGQEPTIPYHRLNTELGYFGEDRETPKVAARFLEAISPLIHASKRIEFIDPYLSLKIHGIAKSQYRLFFEELFRLLGNRGQSKVIVFHMEWDPSSNELLDIEEQKEQYTEYFEGLVPDNIEVQCHWWNDDKTSAFHGRYVLSDKGAVRFDAGFRQPADLDQRRQPADISVVSSEQTFASIRGQFDEFESEMELVDTLVINQK